MLSPQMDETKNATQRGVGPGKARPCYPNGAYDQSQLELIGGKSTLLGGPITRNENPCMHRRLGSSGKGTLRFYMASTLLSRIQSMD